MGTTPKQSKVGDAFVGDSLVDVCQMGPAYVTGSATSDNPFGTPMLLDENEYIDGNGNNWGAESGNMDYHKGYLTSSKTDILVRFSYRLVCRSLPPAIP